MNKICTFEILKIILLSLLSLKIAHSEVYWNTKIPVWVLYVGLHVCVNMWHQQFRSEVLIPFLKVNSRVYWYVCEWPRESICYTINTRSGLLLLFINCRPFFKKKKHTSFLETEKHKFEIHLSCNLTGNKAQRLAFQVVFKMHGPFH